MDYNVLMELLSATVRVAAPLLFVALGAVLSESAGTFAVGVEGMMLMGAFSGAVLTFVTKNWALGFLGSALSGAALALDCRDRHRTIPNGSHGHRSCRQYPRTRSDELSAARIVWRKSPGDQLADAGRHPDSLALQFAGDRSRFVRAIVADLCRVSSGRPDAFFSQKNPDRADAAGGRRESAAAFSAGTDPIRVRTIAIVACGAFAGIGGAVLSLQELGTFTDGMTNGRGFIALAALIIGRWQPLWIMLACLLFGAASALAFNLQGWSLPISSYVIQMTPYLLALAVLCGIGRRARMPAAIGKAFTRN